jgi:hypothetical protein
MVFKYANIGYRHVKTFSNLLCHRFIFQLSHVKIERSCPHKQQQPGLAVLDFIQPGFIRFLNKTQVPG